MTTDVLPAWWLSWYSTTPSSEFELHSPWWVSGYTETATIYVAAVRAVDEAAAWDMIRLSYDNPPAAIGQRFIEPLDRSPFSSRFQQATWMDWDDEGHTCRCEAMHADRTGTVDLEALADEYAYITSVDICCFCGDSECDGIGCIAGIDPDAAGAGDNWHYKRLDELHSLLRQGQAWRVMQTLRTAGADPMDALVVAASALANANNQRAWP